MYYEEGGEMPEGAVLVVPNMVAYIRDVTDVGPIGAVVKRFLKLPLLEMVKLGMRNLPFLPKIVGKDFASGLMILAEMEFLKTKSWGHDTVLLNDQAADLGVAFSNYAVFTRFIKLAHAYGKRAGIWTNNFGPTVVKLGSWRLKPDVLVAPFNKDGYLMNPDKKICEEMLKMTPQEVWGIDRNGNIFLKSKGTWENK